MISVVVIALWTVLKGLERRLEDLEDREHPDFKIVETGHNT